MENRNVVSLERIIDERQKQRRQEDAKRITKRQRKMFRRACLCGAICLAIYFAGFAGVIIKELVAIGSLFSGAMFAFYMGRFCENVKLVG